MKPTAILFVSLTLLMAACASTPSATTAPQPRDYLAELNAEKSAGVTRDNNAAITLLQIIGPVKGIGYPPEIFRQLGVPEDGVAGRHYTPETVHTKRYYPDPTSEDAWKAQDKTLKTLWKKDDLPAYAEWIAANDWVLDAAAKALEKPRFFVPLYSKESPPDFLDAINYRGLGQWRAFANAFHARALLRWNAGDKTGAIADLRAELRLGHAVADGFFIFDPLVGVAIQRQAFNGLALIAREGRPTAADARALLEGLPPMPRVDLLPIYDRGERYFALSAMEQASARNFHSLKQLLYQSLLTPDTDIDALPAGDLDQVDWPVAIATANDVSDRTVRALKIQDFPEGQKALAEIADYINSFPKPPATANLSGDGDWAKYKEESNKHMAIFIHRNPGESRADFSRRIAIRFVDDKDMTVRARALIYQPHQLGQLARIAVALAGHHAQTGKYPAGLADLTPAWLPEIPLDAFSGKPLIYRHEPDGSITLYSIGPNAKDDNGVEGKTMLLGDTVIRLK